jgi:hypothetical protein
MLSLSLPNVKPSRDKPPGPSRNNLEREKMNSIRNIGEKKGPGTFQQSQSKGSRFKNLLEQVNCPAGLVVTLVGPALLLALADSSALALAIVMVNDVIGASIGALLFKRVSYKPATIIATAPTPLDIPLKKAA